MDYREVLQGYVEKTVDGEIGSNNVLESDSSGLLPCLEGPSRGES